MKHPLQIKLGDLGKKHCQTIRFHCTNIIYIYDIKDAYSKN